MRAITLAILFSFTASAAHGEPARDDTPWYRGPHGRHRVEHLALATAGGLWFLISETALKSTLAPGACRWCAPDSLDARVRNAVVWGDPSRAATLANLTGYAAAPVLALGLTVAGALTSDDPTATRIFDDTLPILETAALTEGFDQIIKFTVGRARPYAYYSPPPVHGLDDDLSFFSGHTTLAFGVATSAGMIAHRRHSWTEPYIWIGGMALAVTTGYLRMAADKHYLSDVVVGAAVGTGAGLLLPFAGTF